MPLSSNNNTNSVQDPQNKLDIYSRRLSQLKKHLQNINGDEQLNYHYAILYYEIEGEKLASENEGLEWKTPYKSYLINQNTNELERINNYFQNKQDFLYKVCESMGNFYFQQAMSDNNIQVEFYEYALDWYQALPDLAAKKSAEIAKLQDILQDIKSTSESTNTSFESLIPKNELRMLEENEQKLSEQEQQDKEKQIKSLEKNKKIISNLRQKQVEHEKELSLLLEKSNNLTSEISSQYKAFIKINKTIPLEDFNTNEFQILITQIEAINTNPSPRIILPFQSSGNNNINDEIEKYRESLNSLENHINDQKNTLKKIEKEFKKIKRRINKAQKELKKNQPEQVLADSTQNIPPKNKKDITTIQKLSQELSLLEDKKKDLIKTCKEIISDLENQKEDLQIINEELYILDNNKLNEFTIFNNKSLSESSLSLEAASRELEHGDLEQIKHDNDKIISETEEILIQNNTFEGPIHEATNTYVEELEKYQNDITNLNSYLYDLEEIQNKLTKQIQIIKNRIKDSKDFIQVHSYNKETKSRTFSSTNLSLAQELSALSPSPSQLTDTKNPATEESPEIDISKIIHAPTSADNITKQDENLISNTQPTLSNTTSQRTVALNVNSEVGPEAAQRVITAKNQDNNYNNKSSKINEIPKQISEEIENPILELLHDDGADKAKNLTYDNLCKVIREFEKGLAKTSSIEKSKLILKALEQAYNYIKANAADNTGKKPYSTVKLNSLFFKDYRYNTDLNNTQIEHIKILKRAAKAKGLFMALKINSNKSLPINTSDKIIECAPSLIKANTTRWKMFTKVESNKFLDKQTDTEITIRKAAPAA